MENNINTKNGQLSAYGYACGYVNRVEDPNGFYKELNQEHGIYNVRTNLSHTTRWQSFEKLVDAKKCFNSIKIKSK